MVYNILLGAQIASLIIGFFCIIRLSFLKGSVDSKFLLVSIILVEVYSAGYLQEMLASDMNEAFYSIGTQYAGFGFVALFYAQFICKYTRLEARIPAWFWGLLYGFDALVVGLAMTSKYHNLYYTSKEWVTTGLFAHIETTKSFIYWLFVLSEILLLIGSSIAVLYRMERSFSKKEKERLLVIFFETLVPIAGIILNISGILQGFDMNPIFLSVMISTMTFTLLRGTMFDIINMAHSNFFESTTVANIIIDSEYNYISCNKRAKIMIPELEKWSYGNPISNLGIPGIEKAQKLDFEYKGYYYRTNREDIVENNVLLGHIISITNITDILVQMDRMRELKEKADNANAAKSRYLANMSHEIRTPLNAIIGMAEIAKKENSIRQLQEYITQIKSSGFILLDLINDVLDFSKAEYGKLEIVEDAYDFCDIINSVINIANVRLGDRPVHLYVDVDPTMPRVLYGDETRVRQVIMNLVGNATKYTNDGYVELVIDYERVEDGVFLKLLIEDSGVGIKKEDLKTIFDPFTQVDLKRNKKVEGSGLGLAITKQLIEIMDGSFDVESEYGVGTRFYIKLFQAVKEYEAISVTKEREKFEVAKNQVFTLYGAEELIIDWDDHQSVSFQDAKILVVDDNEINVKVARGLLRLFGIECDVAYSGQECLEKIENELYDLIFMDHIMPGMDGIETTKKIRQNTNELLAKVPVIACTANVDQAVQNEFYKAGMQDYISKPIITEELERILSKYLC